MHILHKLTPLVATSRSNWSTISTDWLQWVTQFKRKSISAPSIPCQVSTLILILSPIDSMSWRRWICNNSHSSGRHWSDFYWEPFCITPSFIVNTANLISSQLPFYDASNAPWRDHQRQIFFFRSCFDSIENVCVLYFRPSRVQFTA